MRKIIIMMILMASAGFAAIEESAILQAGLVNQDPDPAIAGNILDVRISVTNVGGASANDVIVEVLDSYPFQVLDGSLQNLGTILAHQGQYSDDTKIVKFRVLVDKNAPAGSHDLKVKYYTRGSASIQTKSLSIDVKSTENAEVIHIDKTVLVPGKEDTLKFTINNVGNSPLSDLTFSWVNADKILLPVGSDNTKHINSIEVGKSADLEYKVIADSNAVAGLYELQLKLSYDDPLTGAVRELNTIAGIYVGGGTDFDIAFSESSSGQTSFTIANIGSNPASSVSIMVPSQDGWRVTGTNSMIIGNLNTGDYTVASFGLTQSSARIGTGGTQTEQLQLPAQQANSMINLQVAYTDTMGKREIVEKQVAINQQATGTQTGTAVSGAANFRIRQQESFFSKYKWHMVVLAALAVVGIVYRSYSKRKLLKAIDSKRK